MTANITLHGKRILITHVFIQRLMGSTVLTLELADYLQQQGADVTIFCSEYAEPVRSLFEGRKITVIADENYNFHLNDYDYIWVNSQVLPLSIIKELSQITEISSPIFIFNHMSAIDKIADEFPYIYMLEEHLASLVISIAPEVEQKILPYFNEPPKHALFPNPAPSAFSQLPSKRSTGTLQRILIVSNHAPEEVIAASFILQSKGITVTHFGEGGGQCTLVTPEKLAEYDAVITIGKTVQYCLTAGIPVYVYDHFGGFGYLNDSTFDLAAANNFSGRGGEKKSANQIAQDIINNFDEALVYSTQNRNKFIDQYSIDNIFPSLLDKAQEKKIFQLPSSYTLSVMSAERFAYRFYRTWSWANYLEDERYRLSTRQEELITQLNETKTQEHEIHEKLEAIQNSHAYKIGKLLMKPLHDLKMFMQAHRN